MARRQAVRLQMNKIRTMKVRRKDGRKHMIEKRWRRAERGQRQRNPWKLMYEVRQPEGRKEQCRKMRGV